MKRFKDAGQRIEQFTYLFLVHCPRCDECAEVVLRDEGAELQESGPIATLVFAPRRLVCTHCGFVKDKHANVARSGDLEDWYFCQPLWLQVGCCGETLWAFNREHLDFLEDFVAAGVREAYPNGTMASRLPTWMKVAKNREDVLKGIRKLRTLLP